MEASGLPWTITRSSNLRVLMDEIFARTCFVVTDTWKSINNSNNDSKQFSLGHNYAPFYSNTHCKPRTERLFSIILEEDPDVFGLIKPPLNQLSLFWKVSQWHSPSFLLANTTGKYTVEAINEVNNKKTSSKACEGVQWRHFAATANQDQTTWEYRPIFTDNIHPGNTGKYTLGTAHSVKEDQWLIDSSTPKYGRKS